MIKTLGKMYSTQDFRDFQSDKLGKGLHITDPDRKTRLDAYLGDDVNASLHIEMIEDWRDFLSEQDYPDEIKISIENEIKAVESKRTKNNTLYKIIG